MVCSHHLQNHFLFGSCLAVASPIHLLSLSFAPKQMKCIKNGFCFCNGGVGFWAQLQERE